jgi:hypothetical protein
LVLLFGRQIDFDFSDPMSVNDLLLLAFGTGDFEQSALINSRLVRLGQYLETQATFATVMGNPGDHKKLT